MKQFIVLWLLFPMNVAFAQVELTLAKCREMALENSRNLAIADKQLQKAVYEKKAYRANFFPKLSGFGMYAYMQKDYSFTIDGGYLPTFIPDASQPGKWLPNFLLDDRKNPVIGTDGRPVFSQYAFMPDITLSLGLDHAYTVGGVLEQPVYMGGKIRAAYRMAAIGNKIASLSVEYNRAEVLLEADEAYWQCVRLKELVVSVNEYRRVVDELVKELINARETGMTSQNNVLKAQVKLNEVELLLQKARNGQRLAQMNLCRVIGLELNTAVEVIDTLNDFVTPEILNGQQTIVTRPEYNILDQQVALKKQQVELIRSGFLPQLGVSASYGYTDGIAMNGEAEGMGTFMAMASLKVPVFHWNEGRNKLKAAQAEQEISELQKTDVSQKMELELVQSRFSVEDALKRVELTRKSLLQAQENLTESKNRYEVGMETLTNYMEAQAQWQKAWSDWIDAKAELKLSETRYLKATGQLTVEK